jgi:Short C-terminal domain
VGLIGGMARTAVVAGTATAVSNRVSRRQGNRWAQQEEAQAQQQAYTQPPPAPPPPVPVSQDDTITQLQKLGELRAAGVLTEQEFGAQKARILAG